MSFDQTVLSQHHFVNHIRIGDYENNQNIISSIPDVKGLYMVVATELPKTKFLTKGTGGFFKVKDPNVSESILLKNWVEGTRILYIGKAGGVYKNCRVSNATLRERICAYLKFGHGNDIGHWGGRLIWQLEDSRELLIYWRACVSEENPVEMEKELIYKFEEHYGKMPFANLRH